MTDRTKQIIPDSQAVVSCLDREILEALDSHGTFTISELLGKMEAPIISTISIEKFDLVYHQSKPIHNSTRQHFFSNLNNALKNTAVNLLPSKLLGGLSCSLLQPHGQGWQKGKLRICFEFIPEESEAIEFQGKPFEMHQSPLDEIRQLSNKN